MFVYTGDYEDHKSDNISQTTYYTFTPIPLQKGNFYTANDELTALLTLTYHTLGIFAGMIHFLPEKELFEDLMFFRESLS